MIPAGATQLTLTGSVDNNATVFVDGTVVGTYEDGFCHGGGISAVVPDSALRSGSQDHVVAVDATDDGSASYIDIQMTYSLPAGTTSQLPPYNYSRWSGWAARSSNQFLGIDATLEVPALACDRRIEHADSSVWAGLGGFADGDGPLYQAGIDASCHQAVAKYSAWWEYVARSGSGTVSQQDFSTPSIRAGDLITIHVWQSVGKKRTATLTVSGSRGSSPVPYFVVKKVLTRSATGTTPLSAECVAERPTQQSDTDRPLANFGAVHFVQCSASAEDPTRDFVFDLSGGATPNGFENFPVQYGEAGALLMQATNESVNHDFDVSWIRAQ